MNMRGDSLIALFLVFSFAAFAAPRDNTADETLYIPDYAKPKGERELWHTVRDNFLRHQYQRILKKHGLALSCARCNTVYIDVAFSVSATGIAQIKRIDKKKACDGDFSEALLADFLHFIKIYPYPTALYGMSVRLRLDTGLKC